MATVGKLHEQAGIDFEPLAPADPNYATDFVDRILALCVKVSASDLHLQPSPDGLVIRVRLDGVLQFVGTYSAGEATDVVTRIKVLSGLLTYRTDVPQEGRLLDGPDAMEVRVSTFPTIFGERAVLRFFGVGIQLQQIAQLGLPEDVREQWQSILQASSGALLITGPAGSGKTTTAYASLRHLVADCDGGRSIVSLEDPVEVVVPGVAQAQVNEAAELTLHSGLKSILRQDPEVIFIGEIRDRETAEVAFQAALTGQLVLTTFHAGSAAEAVSRLIDMGIEPYVLRSALLGVAAQRLVRQTCVCRELSENQDDKLGFDTDAVAVARTCERCQQTGYAGRKVATELLLPQHPSLANSIMGRPDAPALEALAIQHGMISLRERITQMVTSHTTTPIEARRLLGWSGQR